MLISLIIPTLDGKLPRVLPQSPDLEIVAVKGVSPVAEARNRGLSQATGDWIAWADSDDELLPEWLPTITASISSNPRADVISFDVLGVWDDGSGRKSYRLGGAAHAVDVMAERAAGQLWNKVVRRELFEEERLEGVCHEDYRLLCAVLPKAKQVVHVDKVLYVYHRHANGLSQHVDAMATEDALRGLISMYDASPPKYKKEIAKGVVQRIADFARRRKCPAELSLFVRKHVWRVLLDREISFRIKVKCLFAGI